MASWSPKASGPPAGYAYGPRYRPSLLSVLRGIVYLARGKPRSLGHDALYALADMPAPPLLRGLDHVPEGGALAVVANHYERPGLWMAWPALLLAAALRQRTGGDTHFVAIVTWESLRWWGIPVPKPLIRALFARVFQVYGILPMPPPEASLMARATAMRSAREVVRQGGTVGLMPEGTVGLTPELLAAQEGTGLFLSSLMAAGAHVLPVGLYEAQERLVAAFGQPIEPSAPPGLTRAAQDELVRDEVMGAIRRLLPPALWGAWRE